MNDERLNVNRISQKVKRHYGLEIFDYTSY